MNTTNFELDPRLAADTTVITELALCRVCLMKDARFAWLILVPRRPDMAEIDQLTSSEQSTLWSEVTQAMQALRRVAPCDKLNVGALGNIVRQLHVHVVARRENDAAWPGPVWGAGTTQPYAAEVLEALSLQLQNALLDRD
ncbi:MAG TPA: HIT family protein [Oleiagrimonas sp.]|nr:HIT family protein [Oleiagrimonas sp.]